MSPALGSRDQERAQGKTKSGQADRRTGVSESKPRSQGRMKGRYVHRRGKMREAKRGIARP